MNAVAGTGALIRFALRRDRVRLPVWILLLGGVPGLTAVSFAELFPTEQARAGYAAAVSANPALLALQGPVFGSSLGAVTAARVLMFSVLLIGVMSVLTVVRHTRAEEEAGRRELLGATVVGRQAPLTAALVTALGANLLLGAVAAASLLGAGLPAGGSVAIGLGMAATGWAFAAAAAFTAQLTESARVASGTALSVLGLSYLLRAAGDAGPDNGWLSWLSPLGWAAQVRPFVDERWWVVALAVGLTATLAALAYAASARRDLAAGVLPARPGRAEATAALRSPLALAARQQRGCWSPGWVSSRPSAPGSAGLRRALSSCWPRARRRATCLPRWAAAARSSTSSSPPSSASSG